LKLKIGNLYVEPSGSSDEIRTLQTLLTVKNPKAKFAKSRWNQKEPVNLYFFDEEGRFLRGLLPWVQEGLASAGIIPELLIFKEETFDFHECPVDLLTTPLRDYQKEAVEQAFYWRRGVVQVATGGGKTLIIAAVNKLVEDVYKGTTLTFVNKIHLMHQTVERFRQYGLKNVGYLGAGEYEEGRHMVVMVQTAQKLAKKGEVDFLNVTCVNFDETHHLGAKSWSKLAVSAEAAKFSLGYSGTPFRQGELNYYDPEDIQLLGLTGGVIVRVSASYLIREGYLARPYIFMIPCEEATTYPENDSSWQDVEKAFIVENGYRNNLIARLAKTLTDRGMNPLLLVSKIEHGRLLLLELDKLGMRPLFLSGGPTRHEILMGEVVSYEDEDADASINEYLEGTFNVLIGSTVFDEGVDLPAVSAMINCAGGKAFIKNLQRVGRPLRPKADGPNEAYIFDFWDFTHKWLLKHSGERADDYRTEEEFVVYDDGYSASTEFFSEEW